MFDTDDLVGRDLVEGSCSCSVRHGGFAGCGEVVKVLFRDIYPVGVDTDTW